MINLFTLPDKEPEKSFPYKLRNLALTEFQMCNAELVKVIAQKYVMSSFTICYSGSVSILLESERGLKVL